MRFRAQRRLVARILEAHKHHPYDVVYQFSQIESPWSHRLARHLPPVVVHPEVHAAGELRWHRLEAALGRRCEPLRMRVSVRAALTARTAIQRRRLAHVDALVAPSRVFAAQIERDYGIAEDRVHVIANPIDLSRFLPAPAESRRPRDGNQHAPIQLLFVSRIAVRKGVEVIVDLSHRLSDLAGDVRIRVVGNQSLFSDYRALLADLHPDLATYSGHVRPEDLVSIYHSSDALIQPSHYEPFALTVGEALACGLPVVASDQVGATEGVKRNACRVFTDGRVDELEQEVRDLVADLRAGRGPSLAGVARAEAERLFAPRVVATQLRGVFDTVRTHRR